MRVAVISVHPDDETLGCGGTLLKHKGAKDDLFWLIATQASLPKWSAEVLERKSKEIEKVAKAYGVTKFFKLGFPATRLDQVPQTEMMTPLREILETVKPEIVYLIHAGDIHTDHHAFFNATLSVLKPFYMRQLGVRKILSFETLSSTDAAPPHPSRAFIPNVFCDITPYIDRKIEIMSAYETETQADPMPRGPSAIRALARFRGATIGVDYAEAFMLLREIV